MGCRIMLLIPPNDKSLYFEGKNDENKGNIVFIGDLKKSFPKQKSSYMKGALENACVR